MRLRKIFLPLAAFLCIAIVFLVFAIAVKSRNDRLHANKDATAAIHEMRFSLASSSEAISNAVLSKSDSNAEKFGREALQKIEDFKKARQKVGQDVKGANELQMLQDIDTSFAKFEEVCESLVQSSKQNSNRKAYALAAGPCLDLVIKLDGGLAQSLELKGDAAEESSRLGAIEVYEARLALLRVQSILLQHIFEVSEEVMDSLESKLQLELSQIKRCLSSEHFVPKKDGSGHTPDIGSQLQDFENLIAEIVVLSRQNSNVHAEDMAMTARLEAALNCETKLNAFEQMLHKQLDALLPQGRVK